MSISIYSSYKAHTELKKFKCVSLRSNKKNGARTNAVDDDGVSPGGVRMSNIPQNVVDIRAVRVCGAHAAAILLFFLLLFLAVHRRQAPRSVPAGLPPGHSAQRTHKSNKGKNCLCKRSLRIVLKKANKLINLYLFLYFCSSCFFFISSCILALLAAASSLLCRLSSSSASVTGFLFLVGIPRATDSET